MHKTAKSFGAAKVCIAKELYRNLREFCDVRPSLPGYHNALQTLFFNTSGGEMTRMGVFMRRVWQDCGLPGSPTLGDIRTSISTHVCSFFIHLSSLPKGCCKHFLYTYFSIFLSHRQMWCSRLRIGRRCLRQWATTSKLPGSTMCLRLHQSRPDKPGWIS